MYLELSYAVNKDLPNYPDNPVDKLEPLLRTDKGDQCNVSMIHHFSHNGTHLDVPFHFDPEGKRIDDISGIQLSAARYIREELPNLKAILSFCLANAFSGSGWRSS
jgi:kynurenine formamidase